MLTSCLKAEIFSVKYSTKTQNLAQRIVKKLELKETMPVPIILVYYTQKALKYNNNLMQCMCQHKTIDCCGSKHD